jgi:hypothetical protein
MFRSNQAAGWGYSFAVTQRRSDALTGLLPSGAGDYIFKMAEEQGAEENALVASGLSRREALARVRQYRRAIPGETDVVKLAGLWSIDPTKLLNEDQPLGLGLAARLPKDLAQ